MFSLGDMAVDTAADGIEVGRHQARGRWSWMAGSSDRPNMVKKPGDGAGGASGTACPGRMPPQQVEAATTRVLPTNEAVGSGSRKRRIAGDGDEQDCGTTATE